jgi:hypothetical protein
MFSERHSVAGGYKVKIFIGSLQKYVAHHAANGIYFHAQLCGCSAYFAKQFLINMPCEVHLYRVKTGGKCRPQKG